MKKIGELGKNKAGGRLQNPRTHANTGEEPRGRTRHAQDKPCHRIYNLPKPACKIRGLRINRRGNRAYAQGGRAQDKEHPAHGDGDGFHS